MNKSLKFCEKQFSDQKYLLRYLKLYFTHAFGKTLCKIQKCFEKKCSGKQFPEKFKVVETHGSNNE